MGSVDAFEAVHRSQRRNEHHHQRCSGNATKRVSTVVMPDNVVRYAFAKVRSSTPANAAAHAASGNDVGHHSRDLSLRLQIPGSPPATGHRPIAAGRLLASYWTTDGLGSTTNLTDMW